MSECCQNNVETPSLQVKQLKRISDMISFPKWTIFLYLVATSLFAMFLAFLPQMKQVLLHQHKPNHFILYGPRPEPELMQEYTLVTTKKGKLKADDLKGEALATLNLARDMTKKGKVDKALKLYEHAVALDYSHPDLLNDYGEFLEKKVKDVVLAEHMYCRALILSPKHNSALMNRRRTLPLVEEMDMKAFNRIEKKRQLLLKIPSSHPGLRRHIRESYYQHIHHTTAIEGNTFSLAHVRALVDTHHVIPGKNLQEHNEILGLDHALSFINQTLVQRIGAITVNDILEIHKRVLGHVDPVEAGSLRHGQVFVADYVPPAANEVQQLMTDFVDWLNSNEAMDLQPIELAALAHYKFVIIHPFFDGNGRTARLLMNLILMQAGYPPITILKSEKHEYFELIETGNAGDIRPFIRFIAKVTDRTLDEFLWATQPGKSPSLRTQTEKTIVMATEPEV